MKAQPAKYDGFCVACKKAIKKGQIIEGTTRNYRHADCENPDAPAKIKDPGQPVSAKQRELIATLLVERQFTVGEASALIDYLKKRPPREDGPVAELQESLASA